MSGSDSRPRPRPHVVKAKRVDAERNRQRILETARRLFAAEGLGVSMNAVARAAGIGKATLFRHFDTARDLIDAVFIDQMEAYAAATRRALAEPDAWQGFIHYVSWVCEMQAEDRGFAAVLGMSIHGSAEMEAYRSQSYAGFMQLIQRAKATGHLREEFVSEDLVLLLLANAALIAATSRDAPASSPRLVALVLHGVAAPGAPLPALPPSPSSEALYRALGRSPESPADER